MENIKLTIAYNGQNFCGWQKQKEKRTVQKVLEDSLYALTSQKVEVEGSGRTDKGVHALGQVASVKLDLKMPLQNFKKALNNLLPDDVSVVGVEKVENDFHARFSAKRKTYMYVVETQTIKKNPIIHALKGTYAGKVDVKKIKKILPMFLGEHNFKGFCCADTQVENFDRKIFEFSLKAKKNTLIFTVTGNGFLYNMVRILVGTLLDFGSGKISEQDIKKCFILGERKYSGITIEPNGLYLKCVDYCLNKK